MSETSLSALGVHRCCPCAGSTVVDPGLSGGEHAVAAGLAECVAAAVVLVVGG